MFEQDRHKEQAQGTDHRDTFPGVITHEKDIDSQIIGMLQQFGTMRTRELVKMLNVVKKRVNQHLYAMEKQGIVTKIVECPPTWALKK